MRGDAAGVGARGVGQRAQYVVTAGLVADRCRAGVGTHGGQPLADRRRGKVSGHGRLQHALDVADVFPAVQRSRAFHGTARPRELRRVRVPLRPAIVRPRGFLAVPATGAVVVHPRKAGRHPRLHERGPAVRGVVAVVPAPDRVEVVRQLVDPDIAQDVVVERPFIQHPVDVLRAEPGQDGQSVPVVAVVRQDRELLLAVRIPAAVRLPAQEVAVKAVENVEAVDEGAHALRRHPCLARVLDRHQHHHVPAVVAVHIVGLLRVRERGVARHLAPTRVAAGVGDRFRQRFRRQFGGQHVVPAVRQHAVERRAEVARRVAGVGRAGEERGEGDQRCEDGSGRPGHGVDAWAIRAAA